MQSVYEDTLNKVQVKFNFIGTNILTIAVPRII